MAITIYEAIEILADSAYSGSTTHDEKFKDAEKLGIEALKEIRRLRLSRAFHVLRLLPGETESKID